MSLTLGTCIGNIQHLLTALFLLIIRDRTVMRFGVFLFYSTVAIITWNFVLPITVAQLPNGLQYCIGNSRVRRGVLFRSVPFRKASVTVDENARRGPTR